MTAKQLGIQIIRKTIIIIFAIGLSLIISYLYVLPSME